MRPEPVAASREEAEHVGAEPEDARPVAAAHSGTEPVAIVASDRNEQVIPGPDAAATPAQTRHSSVAAIARPEIGAPKPVPVVRLPHASLPSITPAVRAPAPSPASISAARRAFEIEAMSAHNPTSGRLATPKPMPTDGELIKQAREIEVGNVRSRQMLPPKPTPGAVAVLRRFGDMQYEPGVGGASSSAAGNAGKRGRSGSVRSAESERPRQQKMLKGDPDSGNVSRLQQGRNRKGRNHHRRDEPAQPQALVRCNPPPASGQQWSTAAVPRAVLERCLGLKEATQIVWPVSGRGGDDLWGRPVVILSRDTQPQTPVAEKAEGTYYSLDFELNIRAQPFPVLVGADGGYRYIGNYILRRGERASDGQILSLGKAVPTAVVSGLFAKDENGEMRLKEETRTALLREGIVRTRSEGERMTVEDAVRRLRPMSKVSFRVFGPISRLLATDMLRKDYKGPAYEPLRLFKHRLVFDSFDSEFLERYILHHRR